MVPFSYTSVADPQAAVRRTSEGHGVEFIAGGTDMLQLLQEGVRAPLELVDINGIGFDDVSVAVDGVRIGAMARLADVADHPVIRERFPVVAEALHESASPQVRNMATVGGNLLQRTRCLYFRDVATPCNKRVPGSGCPAIEGQNRINAVLGGSPDCIAAYPGDLAVALIAADAELMVVGPKGERTVLVEKLHRQPGSTPHVEAVLEPGDLITAIWIPIAAGGRLSHYLRVRDRATFEWALASAAVSLGFEGTRVLEARVAAGGVGTTPWRLRAVEELLVGRDLDRALAHEAGERAADGARGYGGNDFKIPLLKKTVTRALMRVGGISPGEPA
ncbi:FAD binding domain-containing protein [Salinarimonas soli]|uniref:Xanthine dehydrogenase family protein subunit M n=1 Tax=Salinarimonas soli TaxID=1638099 RepID=A0A5B2VGP1_9HYPH|nr:xanthine dehydrogenase family protein subunit M [Salinarimonas soli]KAA2237798.1 xanthine dehydrogenase family protein subunit M [Salinarimonas soli]